MAATASDLTAALDKLADAGMRTAVGNDWSPTKAAPAWKTWRSVEGGFGQEVNEADRLSLLLVRAALDYMRSIHMTVRQPYTPLVLGRAALETAIRANHLLEAPDNRERVRRRFNAAIDGMHQGRNIRKSIDNTGYQADGADSTDRRIQAELAKARFYDYDVISVGKPRDRIRHREWVEAEPESVLALSHMYDEEMPQGHGPITWQLLSAATHGQEFGMMMRGRKMPAPNNAGDIMAAVPADGPRLAIDLAVIPIVLMRLMKGAVARFGWDPHELILANIGLLEMWWEAGAEAKSSKQEREELATRNASKSSV